MKILPGELELAARQTRSLYQETTVIEVNLEIQIVPSLYVVDLAIMNLQLAKGSVLAGS